MGRLKYVSKYERHDPFEYNTVALMRFVFIDFSAHGDMSSGCRLCLDTMSQFVAE